MNLKQKKLEKRIRAIAGKMKGGDKDLLLRSLRYAIFAHKREKRKSGEPYIIHPMQVALKLWSKYKDPELFASALLHDAVEDSPEREAKDIYEQFGPAVGFIVDAMNKRILGFHGVKKKFTDRIEKFLWAGTRDIRIFLLKIADRENNLLGVKSLPKNKQIRISFETQAIYEPLGRILGYSRLEKNDLTAHKKNFERYIKRKKIKSMAALKKHLVQNYYHDFSSETFNEVYKNSDKIVWQTEDVDEFARLCRKKQFDRSAKIVAMKTEGGKKTILFNFRHANFKNRPKKIKIKAFAQTV